MSKNLNIELTPFQAVTILGFLREFDYAHHPLLKALGDAVQAFEDELYKEINNEQLQDAFAEIEVKKLIDECPQR